MNIVVLTSSGKTITRPSTTLEKTGHDAYLPEFVNKVSASPALIINISRPGRSIASKFALRYADSVTLGCLLYPENLIDGSPEGFACASCLDHTSHIGSRNFPVESAAISLVADGNTIFDTPSFDITLVAKAIAEVSRFVFIRTGDIVAVELSQRVELQCKTNIDYKIEGFFDSKPILSFNVII